MPIPEEGITIRDIEEVGCEWIVEPDHGVGLARKIEELAYLPDELLEKTGDSGKEFLLEQISTEACLPKEIEIIKKVAQEEAR